MKARIRILYLLCFGIYACSNVSDQSSTQLQDHDQGAVTDSDTIEYVITPAEDSLEVKDSIEVLKEVRKKTPKKTYPDLPFTTKNGESDSLYRVSQSKVTFFVLNQQHDLLDLFDSLGFPMEWWATAMCSFYPLPVDSIPYYLQLARDNGFTQYGFDCERVSGKNFEGVLTNSIDIRVRGDVDLERLAMKYNIELKHSSRKNQHIFEARNLGAKELLKTIQQLNSEPGIVKALHRFGGCNRDIR